MPVVGSNPVSDTVAITDVLLGNATCPAPGVVPYGTKLDGSMEARTGFSETRGLQVLQLVGVVVTGVTPSQTVGKPFVPKTTLPGLSTRPWIHVRYCESTEAGALAGVALGLATSPLADKPILYDTLFMSIAEVLVVVVWVGSDEPLEFVVTGELV